MKKNILLFYGQNFFFLEKEIKLWEKKFISKHGDINILKLDYDEITINILSQELLTPWFLGGFRFIVLKNFPGTKKTDDTREKHIENLLDKIPETNILIFSCPQETNPHSLFKKLLSYATVKHFPLPNKKEIEKYIHSRIYILPKNAKKIIEQYNEDFLWIYNLIEKFSLFFEKKEVWEDDIKKYVLKRNQENIFQIIRSLQKGNIDQIIKDIENQLHFYPIVYIHSMILSQLRKMLSIIICLKQGYDENKIMSQLNLKPFFFSKIKNTLHLEQIFLYIYSQLVELDAKMKTWLLGKHLESNLELHIKKVFLSIKNHIWEKS